MSYLKVGNNSMNKWIGRTKCQLVNEYTYADYTFKMKIAVELIQNKLLKDIFRCSF